ncbi:nucleotidyltransferase [Oleispirillum naphthae]|uniref:nucleotidyltransferase domain-containing protein n=1 Tax=Oleispirillum naphthae TaxID=2838853 RepID=UPI0030826A11
MHIEGLPSRKKVELFGVLERLCERLEPSDTQMERAKSSYQAVGEWLAGAEDDWLAASSIYLQGSTALGTTVKPIGQNEYDVDLVSHIPSLGSWLPPALCKQLVGDRLKANQRYSKILEEKPRCWRLNYAEEFHLDITPSIPNAGCSNGGELVPDKTVQCWKASNPKGYRDAFKRRGELIPQMRLRKSFADELAFAEANIEPFPERPRFKGLLCRIVQIAKRHRDIYFLNRDTSLAPISVIITTLAAWSYEYCVQTMVFDSELDVLCEVIRHMPNFIQRGAMGSHVKWMIWNETTEGENFAERWNVEPAKAQAFFDWHAAAVRDLERLSVTEGLDVLGKNLTASFGQNPVEEIIQEMFDGVAAGRSTHTLVYSPAIGLKNVATPTPRVTPVRSNTFFGAP